MGKTRDSYLETDPWTIVERGFHPERSRVSESIFSLANEHMGVRGSFDEGYSGSTLPGCYVNGVFEQHALREPSAYKGIPRRIRFMVNTVDWLHVRLECDGERLDLAKSRHDGFVRELDLRNGLLRRRFLWHTRAGRRIECTFDRLLSMRDREVGIQRVTFKSLDGPAALEVTLGLDFSLPHECYAESFWACPRGETAGNSCALVGKSTHLGHLLFAGCSIHRDSAAVLESVHGEKLRALCFGLELPAGRERFVEKLAVLHAPRDAGVTEAEAWSAGQRLLERCASIRFDDVLRENGAYWRTVWETADIVVEGDPESQQGIRFSVFQLQQTCSGAGRAAFVGAKGMTGEAYNGHTFWDTEIYCLPHFLFSNPRAARALIDFRVATLPQAMERARELDCAGACFPVATIDGTESCTIWQHANLQLQPTTAVAYAVRHYANVTGDRAYLFDTCIELLVQICRFLATRGQWSGRGKKFGYYAVMGPDEFHMMVNNNAYTNVMARETPALHAAHPRRIRRDLSSRCADLMKRLHCDQGERRAWSEMAEAMIVPCDDRTGVFEQHEGYFDLPHIDVDSIPPEEFPLYSHWSYDRIFRYDMIKQPDVLMFLFLFDQCYSREQKQANYDYYEPRCIHESSLSPSVHSILAAELGRRSDAMELFRFATRIDLDNYNRNTAEGLHMTSLAAAWMNIVYGFGGLRSDGELLSLDPSLPDQWTGCRFRVVYRGSTISVRSNARELSCASSTARSAACASAG